MNTPENDLQALEVTMEVVKKNIERAKTLRRLTALPEFQDIILEGYFQGEAARLVLLRADVAMADKPQQKHTDRLIDGIGALHQYFSTIERMGEMSAQALAEQEQTREELLKEQMDSIEAGAA